MRPDPLQRLAAVLATVLGVGATLGLVLLTGAPRNWGRYVSTAGTPEAPHPHWYLLTVLGAAGTVTLLGWLVQPMVSVAGGALLLGGPLLGLSGAVPCSAGCPLPPYSSTTPQDLLHATASSGAVLCSVLALTQMAVTWATPSERRVAQVAAAVSVSALVGVGLAMLLVGQGRLAGTLERCTLAACITGLTVIAALLAVSRRPPRDPVNTISRYGRSSVPVE